MKEHNILATMSQQEFSKWKQVQVRAGNVREDYVVVVGGRAGWKAQVMLIVWGSGIIRSTVLIFHKKNVKGITYELSLCVNLVNCVSVSTKILDGKTIIASAKVPIRSSSPGSTVETLPFEEVFRAELDCLRQV